MRMRPLRQFIDGNRFPIFQLVQNKQAAAALSPTDFSTRARQIPEARARSAESNPARAGHRQRLLRLAGYSMGSHIIFRIIGSEPRDCKAASPHPSRKCHPERSTMMVLQSKSSNQRV